MRRSSKSLLKKLETGNIGTALALILALGTPAAVDASISVQPCASHNPLSVLLIKSFLDIAVKYVNDAL